MSDNLPPPFEPDKTPPPAPLPPVPPVSKPPSRKVCAALGLLIFFVSIGLTYFIPILCLLGFVVAIISLFFQGYRFIFVGYIATFGVVLLALILYCSTQPFDFK